MALSVYYRYPRLYLLHFYLPPFGRWVKKNHDSIMAHLPPLETGRLLEVGGSIGLLTRKLAAHYPGATILSIDRSASMRGKAETNEVPENVSFQLLDFWDVKDTFDIVVAAGCWEFFDLEPSLDQVDSLLNPNGTLLINTLGPSTFGRIHQIIFSRGFNTTIRLHAPAQLARALARRGYDVNWEPVNPAEGSYTLWARRHPEPSPK